MIAECCVITLAVSLVVLTRVDGGEVLINPAHVTSLRSPERSRLQHLAPGGNCIIDLTGRKFVAVLETCAQVRTLLEAPG